MSPVREHLFNSINLLDEEKLLALVPLVNLLVGEDVDFAIETDLTAEEKAIIAKARKEYKSENYIPLETFLKNTM